MSEKNHSIVVVIIGASSYGKAPQLNHVSFLNAALRILNYCVSSQGLHLPKENILWLFDIAISADQIDLKFNEFLDVKQQESITDLLIYYVGHGFVELDQYYLALQTTRLENLEVSSLSLRSFSKSIERVANTLRTLWIVDACYSAETRRYFQSDQHLIGKQMGGLYSKAGVSLL